MHCTVIMLMWTNSLAVFREFPSCKEHKMHGFRSGSGSLFLLFHGWRWSEITSLSPKYFLKRTWFPLLCLWVSRLLGKLVLMPLPEDRTFHCTGHPSPSRSARGQLSCCASALGLLQQNGTGVPSLQSDCLIIKSGQPLVLMAPKV